MMYASDIVLMVDSEKSLQRKVDVWAVNVEEELNAYLSKRKIILVSKNEEYDVDVHLNREFMK